MPLAATLVEKKCPKTLAKTSTIWGESISNYTFLQILEQCVLRGMKIM